MFAEETTHDLYSAIDLAVDKLEHQAQKPTRSAGITRARRTRAARTPPR
jgi:ribosome-associated translation inhibitor RaiA